VAEHRQPFADVRFEQGGFTIPTLKWRELRFVGALRQDGEHWVRDPARPPGPFAVPGLLPPGARYQVSEHDGRVLLRRLDQAESAAPARPDVASWPARLEAAEAALAAALVEAANRMSAGRAATLSAMGGIAAFVGKESPLTHAVGMGMTGEVEPRALREVEQFYGARGARTEIDVCPHAHPSLVSALAERGYRVSEMNTVLARALDDEPPAADAPISLDWLPKGGEREWTETVARGFGEGAAPSAEMLDPGFVIFRACAPGALLARAGPAAAGAAGMAMAAGVALLLGDAVLPAHRGRGVHQALIAERLRAARQAGCDLATAATMPGSGSERNYLRAGFQVAYTRVHLVR
jgi:GNAT superfamily N-acetyltransferase